MVDLYGFGEQRTREINDLVSERKLKPQIGDGTNINFGEGLTRSLYMAIPLEDIPALREGVIDSELKISFGEVYILKIEHSIGDTIAYLVHALESDSITKIRIETVYNFSQQTLTAPTNENKVTLADVFIAVEDNYNRFISLSSGSSNIKLALTLDVIPAGGNGPAAFLSDPTTENDCISGTPGDEFVICDPFNHPIDVGMIIAVTMIGAAWIPLQVEQQVEQLVCDVACEEVDGQTVVVAYFKDHRADYPIVDCPLGGEVPQVNILGSSTGPSSGLAGGLM